MRQRHINLRSMGAMVLALGCSAMSPWALAQDFPVKTVRLVAPTAVGGNADIVARIAAEGMSRELGQQVYVDNQPGGRQIPGTSIAARARPDGYTLVMVGLGSTANAVLYNDLPYDPMKDFVPVGVIGSTPLAVVAYPKLPVEDMKQLIALAKSKPGALNYASAGVGSPAHLAGELLNSMAGIRLTHIPYKATQQANTDTMTGVVHVSLPSVSSVIPLITAGKLKALGLASVKRSPQMPGLPTIAETLPGFEVRPWNGIEAPAGTPKNVITRLNTAINKGITAPDIKDRLVKAGIDIDPMSPEEMAHYMETEFRKLARIVKEADIKGER